MAQSTSAPIQIASARVVRLIPRSDNEEISVWFTLAERTFRLTQVTEDDEKLSIVLQFLTPTDRQAVMDIIARPDSTYDEVKEALIKRLGTSNEEKIQALLEGEFIGDRTPSQFLRDLQRKGGPLAGDAIIKTQWMRNLPEATRLVVSGAQSDDLAYLASMADGIHAATKLSCAQRSPVQLQAKESSLAEVVNSLAEKVKELTLHMDERVKELSLRMEERSAMEVLASS
ncbi:uncharacterized protein [Atheta coriaria]|uniref:uncharacterized protein n=1 Tax=Dalotia coriaria TaxID=877792 RepID=UPI0031F43104